MVCYAIEQTVFPIFCAAKLGSKGGGREGYEDGESVQGRKGGIITKINIENRKNYSIKTKTANLFKNLLSEKGKNQREKKRKKFLLALPHASLFDKPQ